MNKTTTVKILTGILLAAASSAMAQSALQQLGAKAGIDAAPLSAHMQAMRAANAGPAVSPETAAKVQAAFADAKNHGFPGVVWEGVRVGVRYARVPLPSPACPGCVSYTALLPLGALTPTAPVADPNKATYFILQRSGEWVKPESSFSTPISIPAGKDAFESCSLLDAKSIVPWDVKQAALMVQACLNHKYAADGDYQVRAQAGRFGHRVCRAGVPGAATTCGAIVEVIGIRIVVSGRIPAGDSVLLDLNSMLDRREGKLLGFYAIVENKAEILP